MLVWKNLRKIPVQKVSEKKHHFKILVWRNSKKKKKKIIWNIKFGGVIKTKPGSENESFATREFTKPLRWME